MIWMLICLIYFDYRGFGISPDRLSFPQHSSKCEHRELPPAVLIFNCCIAKIARGQRKGDTKKSVKTAIFTDYARMAG